MADQRAQRALYTKPWADSVGSYRAVSSPGQALRLPTRPPDAPGHGGVISIVGEQLGGGFYSFLGKKLGTPSLEGGVPTPPRPGRDSDLHTLFYWVAAPAFTRGMKMRFVSATRRKSPSAQAMGLGVVVPFVEVFRHGVSRFERWDGKGWRVQGTLYFPGHPIQISLSVISVGDAIEVHFCELDTSKKGSAPAHLRLRTYRVFQNMRRARARLKNTVRKLAAERR